MAVTETSQAAARATDDLYRRHSSDVYRYALAVLGNHADAEDLTQTTFLNAYRSLEQGVHPRKPSSWLLTIASNAIKQRFRSEKARPRQVTLDDRLADTSSDDDGPTVGELLTALSRILPQQRQAIVLREFEGRSYKEIAGILGVTTSALETLLFRARRSLAEHLEAQLTCTEAQLAVSQAADGRLGRKERRRLREHVEECSDCAHFARVQQRHRRALRGLALVPIPVSLTLFKGFEGTATAATLPTIGASAAMSGSGFGLGASGAAGGGVFAGGVALKAAAVVTAASVVGGVGVVGATEVGPGKGKGNSPVLSERPGERLGQVAPGGVLVPGRGVARGKADAPGQTKKPAGARVPGRRAEKRAATPPKRGTEAKAAAQDKSDRQNPRVQGRENAQTRSQKLGTTKAPARAQSSRGETRPRSPADALASG